jgi:hypothetical protein
MIVIRNLRLQAVHLEKKQGERNVLLIVPSRSSVTIADEEMSQDIQIKSERGDLQYTHVDDAAPATPEEAAQ